MRSGGCCAASCCAIALIEWTNRVGLDLVGERVVCGFPLLERLRLAVLDDVRLQLDVRDKCSILGVPPLCNLQLLQRMLEPRLAEVKESARLRRFRLRQLGHRRRCWDNHCVASQLRDLLRLLPLEATDTTSECDLGHLLTRLERVPVAGVRIINVRKRRGAWVRRCEVCEESSHTPAT